MGNIELWETHGLPRPDLIIGGSPCTGFSNSGKRKNFDDPNSRLFFTFVDRLEYYRPKYWLLENVNMKKKWANTISTTLNTDPILIDSALVSAQSRKRLYWTNINSTDVDFFGRKKTLIPQPEDRKIHLSQVIDNGHVDRNKSYCLDANYQKGTTEEYYKKTCRRQIVYITQKPRGFNKGADFFKKSPTLTSSSWEHNNHVNGYRKLTPEECEKLQTVPVGYSKSVSNKQRYKLLGNGWTVDVIAHILKYIKEVQSV